MDIQKSSSTPSPAGIRFHCDTCSTSRKSSLSPQSVTTLIRQHCNTQEPPFYWRVLWQGQIWKSRQSGWEIRTWVCGCVGAGGEWRSARVLARAGKSIKPASDQEASPKIWGSGPVHQGFKGQMTVPGTCGLGHHGLQIQALVIRRGFRSCQLLCHQNHLGGFPKHRFPSSSHWESEKVRHTAGRDYRFPFCSASA